MMIEIKAFFSGWKEADKTTARKFCAHMINGATAIPQNKKAEWLEGKHLRGITVAELFA